MNLLLPDIPRRDWPTTSTAREIRGVQRGHSPSLPLPLSLRPPNSPVESGRWVDVQLYIPGMLQKADRPAR